MRSSCQGRLGGRWLLLQDPLFVPSEEHVTRRKLSSIRCCVLVRAGLGPAPPLITAIQKFFALDRTLASAISATTLAADLGSNRASRWFERETGRSIGEVQRFV